jgi:hypothetical protein
MVDIDCAYTCAAPAKLPWIEAGRPSCCDAWLMAVALLSEPPGGRLKEIVAATRPP